VINQVILDTGPLLDLLLYRYWRDQGRPVDESRLLCRKQFNVSPEDLSRFLGNCTTLIFVPGVFVEIGRLAREEFRVSARRARETALSLFWRSTIRELRFMGVDERWARFLLLDGRHVEELGPTDASLVRCAKDASERAPILTHDEPLWRLCHKESVPCMVTSEILVHLYSI
jgi:hypothetical protein